MTGKLGHIRQRRDVIVNTPAFVSLPGDLAPFASEKVPWERNLANLLFIDSQGCWELCERVVIRMVFSGSTPLFHMTFGNLNRRPLAPDQLAGFFERELFTATGMAIAAANTTPSTIGSDTNNSKNGR